MNLFARTFNKVRNNRYIVRLVFPLAIINVISSYLSKNTEMKILEETINNNDDFFKSIATLGFTPSRFNQNLVSVMPYEAELTAEKIEETAKKTVIAVIMKYIGSENLFGIINVECKLHRNLVITTINPKSLKIFWADLYDLMLSTVITSAIAIGTYFILFN